MCDTDWTRISFTTARETIVQLAAELAAARTRHRPVRWGTELRPRGTCDRTR